MFNKEGELIMSKSMYCPNCGAYVGDCGHEPGGSTSPSTISGTCKCGYYYSVTCYGSCLRADDKEITENSNVNESN